MTADPLDVLRQPTPPAPVTPRAEFAAALRTRIEAALTATPEHPSPTPRPDPNRDPNRDPGHGSDPDPDPDDRTTLMADVLTTTVSITPYLACPDASAAIAFYERAFGAVEVMRLTEPNGRVGHAELSIAGATLLLSDEYPEYDVVSPATLGGTPFALTLDVPNCDEVFAQAVAAGATVLREMADQFYGYRSGQLLDPIGFRWSIQTQLEDLSAEELATRLRELDEP